jgi:rhodanese-related sulfurtransferase
MSTGRLTIDALLAQARARLTRLTPADAHAAASRGEVLLVDIRGDAQRARDGAIPGAIHHPRNVLEWRADPASGHDDPRISGDLERTVVLVCHEGYQSSLAATTLQDLGFANATDLAGGFTAWRASGLPIEPAA